ncbi:MAG: B12-binding domain-containing radical SAM protein [Prevotellaceae bacterium]|jgi:radical SAM superfamily enzyme YgiQ (UPF0313 family)|nr:B12-binding domain-containing radical SAM protein [Prevotellaceae bacterium]
MMKNKKRRLNILLAVPEYSSAKTAGYVMPYGIMNISAVLKQSETVSVFTLNLNHCTQTAQTVLEQVIKQRDIDIIGTGGISGQFADVETVFRMAKNIKPDIIAIAGGGLITSDPEVAMQALEIVDYGVIGEGEYTIIKLIGALYENSDINMVENIIYKTGQGYRQTVSHLQNIDLETLPIPDYQGFDYDKYLALNMEYENGISYTQAAIIGGRSCKYNCTFCFHPTGSLYRQRSLDSLFIELDYLLAHYKINYVAFREELFAGDGQRIFDFCRRIIEYDIVWSIQLRVDVVNKEIVDILAGSNCRYIFLGIESADNRILKSMRKQITVEQVEQALEMCDSAGLQTRSTIIIGDIEETVESTNRTFDWWMRHKKRFPISIDLIIAFPGSALYRKACRNGLIPDPVQFLRDGCPIINLSRRMSDEEYVQTVEKISGFNGISYKVFNYK